MSGQHAFLAPSGYDAWSQCLGKPALEEHLPDRSSPDADYGTLAHDLAAGWLKRGINYPPAWPDPADTAMQEGVRCYVEMVFARVDNYRKLGATVTLLIEQKLPVSLITGEKDAEGTADALLIIDWGEKARLETIDLKFGVGVSVSPEKNGQLSMYALTALLRYAPFHNFTDCALIIHQPRERREPKEWDCIPDDLYAFGQVATERAGIALSLRDNPKALEYLTPGEKQCRFCRAKAHCRAYAGWIQKGLLAGMEGYTKPESVEVAIEGKKLLMEPAEHAAWLGEQRFKVALAMAWCEAILAESNAQAFAGIHIPGWKVVDGKKGNRVFKDKAEALGLIQLHGVPKDKVLSEPALLSPTQLEEKLTGPAYAALWADLKGSKEGDKVIIPGLITQAPAGPLLVPESDPRPPRKVATKTSDFEQVDDE